MNRETKAKTELGELIKGLRELGIFNMKSRDEAVNKLRHTTLLNSWYESEYDTECLDVEYEHIETTIYFTGEDVYIADYIDWWEEDEMEDYVYNGVYYPEQRRS